MQGSKHSSQTLSHAALMWHKGPQISSRKLVTFDLISSCPCIISNSKSTFTPSFTWGYFLSQTQNRKKKRKFQSKEIKFEFVAEFPWFWTWKFLSVYIELIFFSFFHSFPISFFFPLPFQVSTTSPSNSFFFSLPFCLFSFSTHSCLRISRRRYKRCRPTKKSTERQSVSLFVCPFVSICLSIRYSNIWAGFALVLCTKENEKNKNKYRVGTSYATTSSSLIVSLNFSPLKTPIKRESRYGTDGRTGSIIEMSVVKTMRKNTNKHGRAVRCVRNGSTCDHNAFPRWNRRFLAKGDTLDDLVSRIEDMKSCSAAVQVTRKDGRN